jgi:hypothetical protein
MRRDEHIAPHPGRTRLSFKSEARPNFVGCLVEVLSVEGGAETEGDTGAELDVVGQGSDTAVVDLGLFPTLVVCANGSQGGETDLRERAGVKLVLGRNLQADVAAGGGIPGSLSASLDLSVDLVIIARAEDSQVVCGRHSRSIRAL